MQINPLQESTEWLNKFLNSLKRGLSWWNAQTSTSHNFLISINNFLKKLSETDKDMAKLIEELNRKLTPHGIFVSIPLLCFLSKLPNLKIIRQEIDSDPEKGVELLCEKINDTDLLEIIEGVKENHKQQAKILQSAYQAHCEKKFELSVPVFLIQAEGIYIQRFGADLYERNLKLLNNRQKSSLESLEAMERGFQEAIKEISASYGHKGKTPPPAILLRHSILHGRSLNYDTRMNSVKAILLLSFIADLVATP